MVTASDFFPFLVELIIIHNCILHIVDWLHAKHNFGFLILTSWVFDEHGPQKGPKLIKRKQMHVHLSGSAHG